MLNSILIDIIRKISPINDDGDDGCDGNDGNDGDDDNDDDVLLIIFGNSSSATCQPPNQKLHQREPRLNVVLFILLSSSLQSTSSSKVSS